MKSQMEEGAEGEVPMEFGMQHPLSSWMHKSTQKLSTALPVGFLWRFYYVGVVDKIEHWGFSQSPALPALINCSRKGMYRQDTRRQNGKNWKLTLGVWPRAGGFGQPEPVVTHSSSLVSIP